MPSLESTINRSDACITPTFLRRLRDRKQEEIARHRPKSDTEITKVMKVGVGYMDHVPTKRMCLPRARVRAKTLRGTGTVCGPEAAHRRRHTEQGKRGARPVAKTYEVANYNPINNPMVMERDVAFRVVQSAEMQAARQRVVPVAIEPNSAASNAYIEIAIEVEIDVSEFVSVVSIDAGDGLRRRLARFGLAVLALLGFVGLNLSFA